MKHENLGNPESQPAPLETLADIMDTAGDMFDDAYEAAAEQGEHFVTYSLGSEQLQGSALESRYSGIDVQYGYADIAGSFQTTQMLRVIYRGAEELEDEPVGHTVDIRMDAMGETSVIASAVFLEQAGQSAEEVQRQQPIPDSEVMGMMAQMMDRSADKVPQTDIPPATVGDAQTIQDVLMLISERPDILPR